MSLLTTNEVAKILRVTPQTVTKLIRTGVLPAIRVGIRHRVRRDHLLTFIEGDTHDSGYHNRPTSKA